MQDFNSLFAYEMSNSLFQQFFLYMVDFVLFWLIFKHKFIISWNKLSCSIVDVQIFFFIILFLKRGCCVFYHDIKWQLFLVFMQIIIIYYQISHTHNCCIFWMKVSILFCTNLLVQFIPVISFFYNAANNQGFSKPTKNCDWMRKCSFYQL